MVVTLLNQHNTIMAVITTRPFSPRPNEPFTGFLVVVDSKLQQRKAIEIKGGVPTTEPLELAPGNYSAEWIEAEKPPKDDYLRVPDEPEVELKDILASLKGKGVDKEAVKEAIGEPKPASDQPVVPVSDPTVASQPPATEQEVAPQSVSTKRGGGSSASA